MQNLTKKNLIKVKKNQQQKTPCIFPLTSFAKIGSVGKSFIRGCTPLYDILKRDNI